MALYKYSTYLTPSANDAFDTLHEPGTRAPDAGIYRCHGCGHEIGIAHAHILPPQNHHQHGYGQGPIQWRLVVFAQHT
jgi:hypothetical protein